MVILRLNSKNIIHFVLIYQIKYNFLSHVSLLYYQARMPNASILLVATFLDRNTLPTKQQDVLRIKQLLLDRYGPEGDRASGLSSRLDTDSFIPVSCTTKEGMFPLLYPSLKFGVYCNYFFHPSVCCSVCSSVCFVLLSCLSHFI